MKERAVQVEHNAPQQRLTNVMDGIHDRFLDDGRKSDDYGDYVKGANTAGFKKVADAMLPFGVV